MRCVFLKIEPPGVAFDYILGGAFVFGATAEISMLVCCVEIMKLRFGSVDKLLAVDK